MGVDNVEDMVDLEGMVAEVVATSKEEDLVVKVASVVDTKATAEDTVTKVVTAVVAVAITPEVAASEDKVGNRGTTTTRALSETLGIQTSALLKTSSEAST